MRMQADVGKIQLKGDNFWKLTRHVPTQRSVRWIRPPLQSVLAHLFVKVLDQEAAKLPSFGLRIKLPPIYMSNHSKVDASR